MSNRENELWRLWHELDKHIEGTEDLDRKMLLLFSKYKNPSGTVPRLCRFTRSLDAVMTIIPDVQWRVGKIENGRFFKAEILTFYAYGSTAPLALCMALVQAEANDWKEDGA